MSAHASGSLRAALDVLGFFFSFSFFFAGAAVTRHPATTFNWLSLGRAAWRAAAHEKSFGITLLRDLSLSP